MAFVTFSGDTTPSLADLDANFAKCIEQDAGVALLSASPALTNTGNQVATMQAVRQLGMAVRSIATKTTTATLTAADVGTLQLLTGSSAYTVTLPAASALPAGTSIAFVGAGVDVAITLARAGTDTITDGSVTGLTSIATYAGMDFVLVSNGSNGWVYFGSRRRFVSAWTATLPAANTATAFTHGLGTKPTSVRMEADCTTTNLSFAVGDRIEPISNLGTFGFRPQITSGATSVTLVASNQAAPWSAIPATGGVTTTLTNSSWRYRVIAEV